MPSLFQYPSPALHSLFTIPVAFIASFYIYFFIASTLQSCVFSYSADFLRPSISLLCFPYAPPHFCLYLLAGWKLNCDPAHCSILGAAIWECIGIHVVFLHLALYQSCLWFSTTGQRRTSSGVSASFVPPERQHRGALLLLDTKTKWLHMQQKHKHSRQLEKQLVVKQNQVVHIDNPH